MGSRRLLPLLAALLALAVVGPGCPDGQTDVESLQARAEAGDADAQYELGILYYRGTTVSRDLVEAYTWFGVAAEGLTGDAAEMAAQAKEETAGAMTSEQVAEAEDLIRHWLEAHPRRP